MKLLPTIIAAALLSGVVLPGCSEDTEAPGTAGTSGKGAGGIGGSGGAGGAGARGGMGASAGSSGVTSSDAQADREGGQCNDRDPREIQECKSTGTSEGVCASLVNCSCDKCACLLAECQANPGCLALRQCALRTGCCSPALVAVGCMGTICDVACTMELLEAGTGLALALNLDGCVYNASDAGGVCTPCPAEAGAHSDAGDAAGGG